MNRRAFLTRTLAFLPLPAFVRAASLWLPKEKPRVQTFIWPPEPVWHPFNGIINLPNITFVDAERWATLMDEPVDHELPLKVQVLARDILTRTWVSAEKAWSKEIQFPEMEGIKGLADNRVRMPLNTITDIEAS